MSYTITKSNPFSASIAFEAQVDGKRVGSIYLDRRTRDGQKVMKVRNVEVDRAHQRKGIATKLYQAAARAACDEGRPLVSDERTTGAHSNDFWLKQAYKGRAIMDGCKDGKPVFVLRCFAADDLSGVKKPTKRTSNKTKRRR